jgi:hypothetical protein
MLTMENGLLFIEAALFGRLIRFSLRSKRTESVVERKGNGGEKAAAAWSMYSSCSLTRSMVRQQRAASLLTSNRSGG